jgi:hypothetical protein
VREHRQLLLGHNLYGVYGSHHRSVSLHQAKLPQKAEFQIGEASPLAGTTAVA